MKLVCVADYAMPAETIIVGDLKGEFLHKRGNESRTVQLDKDDSRVLAGLIFARDIHRPARKCLLKNYSTSRDTYYLYFAWLNIPASSFHAVLIMYEFPIEILSFHLTQVFLNLLT